MFISNTGHMARMVSMSIYGKKPSKLFAVTGEPISRRFGRDYSATMCL